MDLALKLSGDRVPSSVLHPFGFKHEELRITIAVFLY